MAVSIFTIFHFLVPLVGTGAGLVSFSGVFNGKRPQGRTAVFLLATVFTGATGFLFSRDHILPSQVVGAPSLAPTQSEPSFLVVQVLVFATFITLGVAVARRLNSSSQASS